MSPHAEYAITSLLWALTGLVTGYTLGRITRDAEVITASATERSAPMPTPRRRWASYERVIGAVVLLLGLATAAQGLYQDSATRRVAECTRAYAVGFADALDARTQSSTETQEALDRLISTVGETPGADQQGRGRLRAAVQRYLAARAEQRRQQAEHPYPPAPRDICQ